MLRRKIPNTDLEVSPLCLGTMTFGNPVEEERAIAMVSVPTPPMPPRCCWRADGRAHGQVHACIDMGVNFFDTANVYQGCESPTSPPHPNPSPPLGASW